MPNPRKPRTFIPSKYTRYTVDLATSNIQYTCNTIILFAYQPTLYGGFVVR